MNNSPEAARKEYTADLEKALHNLYDPLELRKSHLIGWLNLAPRDDPAATLRRAVVDAIQSLKPDARIPSSAQSRRIFEVLTYRFIEQTSQKEVATDLALSIRQLRRLEIQAILTLAEQLLIRHPENRILGEQNGAAAPAEQPLHLPELNNSDQAEAQELALLRTSSEKVEIRVADLVENVIRISEPLAARWKMRVVFETGLPPAPVLVHLVTLRQTLLSILTVALQFNEGGILYIRAEERERSIVVTFHPASPAENARPDRAEQQDALHLAAELAELSQARIQIAPDDQPWQVEVSLPRLERIPVFVIDDNTDALRLIERYLEGSPFRCQGVHDPVRALAMAEEARPQIILLDVMLPGIDGWEILGRIREHPSLGNVPVIITTILPQETLALTLGAAGFLRKPFTREALLQVLHQQLDPAGIE